MLTKIKQFATLFTTDLIILFHLIKSKETDLPVKIFAVFLLSYMIIPTDVLPEFIPFIGIVDDSVVLLLGTYLIKTVVPGILIDQYEEKAQAFIKRHKNILIYLMVVFTALFLSLVYLIVKLFLEVI